MLRTLALESNMPGLEPASLCLPKLCDTGQITEIPQTSSQSLNLYSKDFITLIFKVVVRTKENNALKGTKRNAWYTVHVQYILTDAE